MTTNCYELVRGSAIRVTGLDKRGGFEDEIRYGVSKSVVRVVITETVEAGGNEIIRNSENVGRLKIVTPGQTIRYKADIEFLRVDPDLFSLMTGQRVVYNAEGDAVGIDAATKVRPVAFGLEVWSRLAGRRCSQQWGYTLFPFLKGGLLSGTSFANGLVSFSILGAQTRRMSKWGYGPYVNLNEDFTFPEETVSGNLHWRNMIVTEPPPEQTDGVLVLEYEIDGGDATMGVDVEIDGGDAFDAGPLEFDGGEA